MRFMIACAAAAVAAVALAAPSFAQEANNASTPAAPAEATPAAKPKAGTAAYCNSLKSTASKTACLKRLHAAAGKPATAAQPAERPAKE